MKKLFYAFNHRDGGAALGPCVVMLILSLMATIIKHPGIRAVGAFCAVIFAGLTLWGIREMFKLYDSYLASNEAPPLGGDRGAQDAGAEADSSFDGASGPRFNTNGNMMTTDGIDCMGKPMGSTD